MEINQIVTFEGENWLLEEIKPIDEHKSLLIFSKTDAGILFADDYKAPKVVDSPIRDVIKKMAEVINILEGMLNDA